MPILDKDPAAVARSYDDLITGLYKDSTSSLQYGEKTLPIREIQLTPYIAPLFRNVYCHDSECRHSGRAWTCDVPKKVLIRDRSGAWCMIHSSNTQGYDGCWWKPDLAPLGVDTKNLASENQVVVETEVGMMRAIVSAVQGEDIKQDSTNGVLLSAESAEFVPKAINKVSRDTAIHSYTTAQDSGTHQYGKPSTSPFNPGAFGVAAPSLEYGSLGLNQAQRFSPHNDSCPYILMGGGSKLYTDVPFCHESRGSYPYPGISLSTDLKHSATGTAVPSPTARSVNVPQGVNCQAFFGSDLGPLHYPQAQTLSTNARSTTPPLPGSWPSSIPAVEGSVLPLHANSSTTQSVGGGASDSFSNNIPAFANGCDAFGQLFPSIDAGQPVQQYRCGAVCSGNGLTFFPQPKSSERFGLDRPMAKREGAAGGTVNHAMLSTLNQSRKQNAAINDVHHMMLPTLDLSKKQTLEGKDHVYNSMLERQREMARNYGARTKDAAKSTDSATDNPGNVLTAKATAMLDRQRRLAQKAKKRCYGNEPVTDFATQNSKNTMSKETAVEYEKQRHTFQEAMKSCSTTMPRTDYTPGEPAFGLAVISGALDEREAANVRSNVETPKAVEDDVEKSKTKSAKLVQMRKEKESKLIAGKRQRDVVEKTQPSQEDFAAGTDSGIDGRASINLCTFGREVSTEEYPQIYAKIHGATSRAVADRLTKLRAEQKTALEGVGAQQGEKGVEGDWQVVSGEDEDAAMNEDHAFA